jgi:hypothetical protein
VQNIPYSEACILLNNIKYNQYVIVFQLKPFILEIALLENIKNPILAWAFKYVQARFNELHKQRAVEIPTKFLPRFTEPIIDLSTT